MASHATYMVVIYDVYFLPYSLRSDSLIHFGSIQQLQRQISKFIFVLCFVGTSKTLNKINRRGQMLKKIRSLSLILIDVSNLYFLHMSHKILYSSVFVLSFIFDPFITYFSNYLSRNQSTR